MDSNEQKKLVDQIWKANHEATGHHIRWMCAVHCIIGAKDPGYIDKMTDIAVKLGQYQVDAQERADRAKRELSKLDNSERDRTVLDRLDRLEAIVMRINNLDRI